MDASQSIIYKLCEILYFLTGKLFNKAEEEKGISKFTIIMCGGQKDGATCKQMVTARWCPWVTSHCDTHHKRIIAIPLSLYNDSAT